MSDPEKYPINTFEPTPEKPTHSTSKWETEGGGTVGIHITDKGSDGQHTTIFVDDGQGESRRVSVDSPSQNGGVPGGDTEHSGTHANKNK